jgi:hypothetical protein
MSKEVKRRNHKAEAAGQKGNMAFAMAEVKQARMDVTGYELMQIAQVMCFCGLPYKRTEERAVVRQARTADGNTLKVTFRAMIDGVDIPFGTDRSLLHWMCHKAVTSKSPFIPMGSVNDYLRDMNMADSGANIKRVREAFQRIASFALVVEREGIIKEQLITPIIQAARLPRGMQLTPRGAQMSLLSSSGEELGFTIAEGVYREFMGHHVPALKVLLQVTREKPQTQDAMLFLQWRSYVAGSDTLIPWSAIRQQLWTEDSNPWRLKGRFEAAIEALKVAWPELNATATAKGLEIGPPRGRSQFLPGTSERHTSSRNASRPADPK